MDAQPVMREWVGERQRCQFLRASLLITSATHVTHRAANRKQVVSSPHAESVTIRKPLRGPRRMRAHIATLSVMQNTAADNDSRAQIAIR
ncbi:MAG TPA: hypothetical protein VGW76_11325 [Pyrinomonadaceae bacterium]|nr:hypothetical protein [Pyrinomonadaceae bacterium]